MKRLFCVVLALLCMVSAYACAEGKLTVTQKSLFELEADDSGYFFAKIENTGDGAHRGGLRKACRVFRR